MVTVACIVAVVFLAVVAVVVAIVSFERQVVGRYIFRWLCIWLSWVCLRFGVMKYVQQK